MPVGLGPSNRPTLGLDTQKCRVLVCGNGNPERPVFAGDRRLDVVGRRARPEVVSQADLHAGQPPPRLVHDASRDRGPRALGEDDLDRVGRRVRFDRDIPDELRLASRSDDPDGVARRVRLLDVMRKPQVVAVLPYKT